MADFGAAAVQPPYLSRPVALPSLAVAGRAAAGASGRGGTRRLPNPVSAVKRRIASSLALRQTVSVTWLGYLTVWLLIVLVVAGSALVFTVLPALTDLLQNASLTAAWAHLTTDQQSLTKTLAIVFGAVGVASLLCFSVFLGLTTHNAPGLGADMPMLTPYGAGIIWPVVVWTQVRLAVGMIVPAALIWLDYPIPGLIAAIVAIEIAQRHMDDPFGWLTRPYRHLPDLYAKLGIEGSIESPMASLWSACFRAANVLAIATYALPMLALVLTYASDALGRDNVPGWQSTGLGPAQLGVALLVGSLVAWTAGAVALLVPITVGLVHRQRTRRTLVRIGRSRSWVSRPGQRGFSPAHPGQADPSYDDYDDDRVIEHFPRQAPGGDPGFEPGGSPDFGPNGEPRGNAGPDQASLYSPSTTSSFPWSGGPPSPPD
ncbi:MAG: hypothetical protein ABSE70_10725 [Candidatus Limnocylindrales bacterium]